MARLSRYKITFSCDGLPDVVVLHDSNPVTVGGYGGWTTVQRQRRVSLTQWQGKDPLTMDVPVLFDGYADGNGQEIQISTLSRMALPIPPTGEGGEPPVVHIKGDGVPQPGPTDWVINSIDWGTNTIWDFDDNGKISRMRQDAVVHLLQYVAEDRVAFSVARLGAGVSKQGWPKTYSVKQGDTLQRIAAKLYGDATKWKKIATANGIRDPKNLAGFHTVRVPAP